MKTTFPVNWRRLCNAITRYVSIAIAIPLLFFMAFRFVSMGFDYNKTFQHLSLPMFCGTILVGIPLLSFFVGLIISQLFRLCSVTIEEHSISGRNYWGMKKTIPLTEITDVRTFSNNGINAIVVGSKYHGEVYIPEHTERLSDLLQLLEPHLTNETNNA